MVPEELIQRQIPKDALLCRAGKVPEPYVMCTQGQRQIRQARLVTLHGCQLH